MIIAEGPGVVSAISGTQMTVHYEGKRLEQRNIR